MQRNVFRKANEHRLLVEHVLALVHHLPREHRSRKPVDRAALLRRLRTLVDKSQFALGSVIQADAPVKELPSYNLRWGSIHCHSHSIDAPNLTWILLLDILARNGPQHREVSTTPLPGFCFTKQVARGVDLCVLQTVFDNEVSLGIVRNLMAGVLKNDGKEMPRNLEEAFLPALQHRLQVFASKLARGILEFRKFVEGFVVQDIHTVRLVQTVHNDGPHILCLYCLDLQLLCKTEEIQTFQRCHPICCKTSEIQQTDEGINHSEFVFQLHPFVAGVLCKECR
mmetsp:Transcript_71113/g.169758  ORF Transcript_71113/g.169758 Transcript_71113/m.169758 type:complete len:282 (-) Transcript_71113:209-1054(-)